MQPTVSLFAEGGTNLPEMFTPCRVHSFVSDLYSVIRPKSVGRLFKIRLQRLEDNPGISNEDRSGYLQESVFHCEIRSDCVRHMWKFLAPDKLSVVVQSSIKMEIQFE